MSFSDPSNSIYFVYTGIQEQQDRDMRVIPNSTTGRFSSIPGTDKSGSSIVVSDLMNNEIKHINCNLEAGKAVTLDLTDQPAGIYLVRIKTVETIQTLKVLIQ